MSPFEGYVCVCERVCVCEQACVCVMTEPSAMQPKARIKPFLSPSRTEAASLLHIVVDVLLTLKMVVTVSLVCQPIYVYRILQTVSIVVQLVTP